MGNTHLKLVVPIIEKRTVMPKRAKNADLRTREYLTGNEVGALIAAARQNRWEFLLFAAPIPVPNGTGSLINPIAVF